MQALLMCAAYAALLLWTSSAAVEKPTPSWLTESVIMLLMTRVYAPFEALNLFTEPSAGLIRAHAKQHSASGAVPAYIALN